jgi:hypothetical protein
VGDFVEDVANINQLLGGMGAKFRAEMARPAHLAPRWFPVSQSFTLAATQDFLTLPTLVNRVLSRLNPADVGQRSRRLGSPVSPLAIWLFGYHFLVGREALIDAGVVRANTRAEKIAQVLNYWREVALVHRGDGRLDNSDAGATNLFLPPTIVQTLYQSLVPLDARIQRLIPEFWKTMEEYLFLLNAEARLGVTDSGPYPLNVERVLIVRDFFDLKGRYYPWRDVVADVPYHCCALAFTLDPADFQSIELTDRSELFTIPARYVESIREIALFTSDDSSLHPLPFTEMDWLMRTVKRAQPKLLKWFERLSRREWIVYGALPWVQRPYALVSRMDEAVHELDREALKLLASYENDDQRAVRWATQRCLVPGQTQVFTPLS